MSLMDRRRKVEKEFGAPPEMPKEVTEGGYTMVP